MIDGNDVVRGKVAFEIKSSGLNFIATYLESPKGDALVEISKDGLMVKKFLWPAYKIWNIAAHADEIASDINSGLAVAGSDGLGGGVSAKDVP